MPKGRHALVIAGTYGIDGYVAAPQPSPTPQAPFQQRVQPWLLECFGAEIAADRMERNHRFLEESLELVQSLGCTASEAHQLVAYVFGRPVGDPPQEVGGVMVTLAALCLASGLDMHDAGEVELVRISVPEIVAKIRAKQAAKPKHSPLPQSPPPQADSQPAPVEVADAMADSQYLAGVSAGWNAANADDPNAALQKLHESRAGYLKPLRAGRATADSVTAPAGPSKPLPYEPTSAMLIAAREQDPALSIETVRAIYWAMWRKAPPTQAAAMTTNGGNK